MDDMTKALVGRELERLRDTAARRLELLRDLVDAFEANCFLADQLPEETTAYLVAKKELADVHSR